MARCRGTPVGTGTEQAPSIEEDTAAQDGRASRAVHSAVEAAEVVPYMHAPLACRREAPWGRRGGREGGRESRME